ncbi:BTAD domain-containing putative transcriptional regulator [Dactylosporangium sp. NPDC005572]|uniref:AfsR/SARP family transcriptional regulator n=1 Tax=Dactylosporangium sp. NPDC005572 TaxID=3156889 RepID=UPI0033A52467
MQVRLLGTIDVTVDAVHRPVHGVRRKAVLAALAIRPGEVVSTDRIADVVWGADPPATAVNTLQRHVSHLRQVLGRRDAILARAPGYVLDLLGDGTDAAVAERLIRQAGEAADRAEAVRHLRAALALWRGRPLEDVVGRAWLDVEAERLENLWLLAQHALAEHRLHLGEHAELIPDLERLTRDHPHDERFHAHLMLAQYRAGRPADALATYQRVKRAFDDDLGLDPGPALRDLEAAVLRQDASLDLAPPPVTVRATGPAQLPSAVRGFTGHAGLLDRLDVLAGESGGTAVVCTVTGPPGAGKTSLAVHWAHRAAGGFPDGRLYVNLRGFDPRAAAVDPGEALRGFLDAFHVPVDRRPAGLDAQASLYRSILNGRRVLIVLDNARDAEQVRPLLPGAPGCLVIVTSRDRLTPLVAAEGAHPFPVGPLTEVESWDLLAARLGPPRVAAEPDAVGEIVARCGRLPLALAIVAAHAVVSPDAPLAAQAAQLRAAAGGLDPFDGGDAATDVRAVFSWSYRALDEPAARLFRLLGLHPGVDFAAPAAASAAGVASVEPLLRSLLRANLLTEHRPGRYRLHDLLRSYAYEQCVEDERGPALRRLLDHYLQSARAAVLLLDPGRSAVDVPSPAAGATTVAFADRDRALEWFAAEHAALLAAVDLGAGHGFDRHVWPLAWSLTTYFDWRGHWDELIATQTAALTALRRVGDRSAAAHTHRDLGRTFAQLGRFAEAALHLNAALNLYGDLDDVVGQARTHHNIGWMLQAQGDHRAALTHSSESHRLFRSAGDRLWQARTLNARGWLHGQLGEHEHSLRLCESALALLQELDDGHGEAGTWDSIAYAHDQLGDHAAALECYRRSIDTFARLGDRGAEADVLVNLGDSHAAAGDHDRAERAWRTALAAFEALGHPSVETARSRLRTRTPAVP